MAEDISIHKLLVWLKHGRSEAICILYPRYAKCFYWYAIGRNLTHEEAEDVVSVVFHKILTGIGGYDEVLCKGEQWMWTICKNHVTDVQKSKKRQMLELLEDYPSSEDTDPEKSFEKRERYEAVLRALEKISEADREELRRGRGRGPGRKAWHEAVGRLRALFLEEYRV